MLRRSFLKWTAAAVGSQAATERPGSQAGESSGGEVPTSIRALRPMTSGIVPITNAERLARLEKARRLMTENRIEAILLEGGSSLFYFTGVRWGLSERPFV